MFSDHSGFSSNVLEKAPDWREARHFFLVYDNTITEKELSMMRFEGTTVPGADWVEIVNVRNKDGSPLTENNWRRNLFGRITLCWVAGGFRNRGLFFKGKIYMGKGKPAVVDLDSCKEIPLLCPYLHSWQPH